MSYLQHTILHHGWANLDRNALRSLFFNVIYLFVLHFSFHNGTTKGKITTAEGRKIHVREGENSVIAIPIQWITYKESLVIGVRRTNSKRHNLDKNSSVGRSYSL